MSRRLPIYFLLDVSESMAGDELYQMEEILSGVVQTITKDPHCLDTVHVEFIGFAGKAKRLSPLTELGRVTVPELPIGGGTALGEGLNLLMAEISSQTVLASPESKGDWKPLVFLITDGKPTDDYAAAVQKWNQNFSKSVNLIAVSVADNADYEVLKSLTDTVVSYFDTTPESLHDFIKWISQSILSVSKSVVTDANLNDAIAPLDGDAVKEASNKSHIDERFVVLVGRCEKSKHPYLIKYEEAEQFIKTLELPDVLKNAKYALVKAMQLKESYFDLTNDLDSKTIDVYSLLGAPDCPHCGNSVSVASCGTCGNIHCISGPGTHICPWCGTPGDYEASEDDSTPMEVKRGLG